jgi:hypothetical protein
MARKKLEEVFEPKQKPWVAIGFDVSMSSFAGAGYMYDALLDRERGPAVKWTRFKGDHYYDRCTAAARGHEMVLDIIGQLKGVPDFEHVYIGIEEPWPFGLVKRAQSGWLKQQAQIQGIFLGSLLRFGFTNIFEVNTKTWQKSVGEDMGMKLNKDFTKWTVKEWAMKAYGVEDYPDLIQTKNGKQPQPKTSKAKPIQTEDVYDAVGIMDWMRMQIEDGSATA